MGGTTCSYARTLGHRLVERDDLIASPGADCPIPNLPDHLAAPGCKRLGSYWDRCGVHYVTPIEM
jgi:hypothetical protein